MKNIFFIGAGVAACIGGYFLWKRFANPSKSQAIADAKRILANPNSTSDQKVNALQTVKVATTNTAVTVSKVKPKSTYGTTKTSAGSKGGTGGGDMSSAYKTNI